MCGNNDDDSPQTNVNKPVRFRKIWIHILVWVTLIVYLAIINPIYISHLQGPERADPQWLDALAETRIHHYIDLLRLVRRDNQEVYRMDGWAVPENADLFQDQFRKQIILIDDESGAILFDTIDLVRPDVDEHYSFPNQWGGASGFAVYIPKYALPRGIYQVAIAYTSPSTVTEYTRTQFYIERTPNRLVLHQGQPASPASGFEQLATRAKSTVKGWLLTIDPSGELLTTAREMLGFEDRE
jgi:hypothetical protein